MFSLKRLLLLLPAVLTVALWTASAQRRIEVRPTNHAAELRRTAYCLGVSVERVQQSRRLLRLAGGLVKEIAGEVSVAPLGRAWARLDRGHAETELQKVVDQLRSAAARSTDVARYRQITEDARLLMLKLVELDPGRSHHLTGWPEGPDGVEGSLSSSFAQHGSRELHTLAERNPDAALTLLAELEQGIPNERLRGPLLWGLAGQGRIEEANNLLNETLQHLSGVASMNAVHLTPLLYYAAQYSRESLPDVMSLWVEGRIQSDSHLPASINGVEIPLTRFEMSVLQKFSHLRQMAPEAVDQALGRFPDLQSTLESVGGFDGLSRLTRPPAAEGHPERSDIRRALATDPDSLLNVKLDSDEHLRRHISRVLEAARVYAGLEDWDSALAGFRVAERLLLRCENPLVQLHAFRDLATMRLRLEGELPEPLLSQGWEILDRAYEAAETGYLSPPSPPPVRPGSLRELEKMERWLLAVWLWNDLEAALPNLENRDELTRFQTSLMVIRWLTDAAPNVRDRSFYWGN